MKVFGDIEHSKFEVSFCVHYYNIRETRALNQNLKESAHLKQKYIITTEHN